MMTSESSTAGRIDSFVLKIIAIVAMTADHIGTVFAPQLPMWGKVALFAPGGLTFPIMAFLLTVGYQHTRNVRKYIQRLFVFALIAIVPFWWALMPQLNVLFTLLMGLIIIYLYDHLKNRLLFVLALLVAIIATGWCDWSYVGVPMILCYHIIRHPVRRVVFPVALMWFTWILELLLLSVAGTSPIQSVLFVNLPGIAYVFVGCTLTIPLLLSYNGRRGAPLKYFFYAYYPAHLALLALIRLLALGDGGFYGW
jgi:hypothetical protein